MNTVCHKKSEPRAQALHAFPQSGVIIGVISVLCLISSSSREIYFLLWQLISPLGRAGTIVITPNPSLPPFNLHLVPLVLYLKVK